MAAGDSAVLDGYVHIFIFARNGDNRFLTITRQRKPAEVERQRLVNLDIFRNITEHDDSDIAVCIINVCSINRTGKSRILGLTDLCSACLFSAAALGGLTRFLPCRIFRPLR